MTRTHEVEFVLLRHGQTEWNRQGIIQGQEDAKLDGDGVRQAEALGAALAGGRFGSIDVVAAVVRRIAAHHARTAVFTARSNLANPPAHANTKSNRSPSSVGTRTPCNS